MKITKDKNKLKEKNDWEFLYESDDGVKFFIQWDKTKHESNIMIRASIHNDRVEIIDKDTGQEVDKEELLKSLGLEDMEVKKIITQKEHFDRMEDLFYVMFQDKEITCNEYNKAKFAINEMRRLLGMEVMR